MGAILYYWKDYQKNTRGGLGAPRRSPPEKLYQRAPRFRSLERGDRVWLITSRPTAPTSYVLLGRLVVEQVGVESSKNAHAIYGPYFITPDPQGSQMIQGLDLPDVELTIRTQLSIKARAQNLGASFQGFAAVRSLTEEDETALSVLMRQACRIKS